MKKIILIVVVLLVILFLVSGPFWKAPASPAETNEPVSSALPEDTAGAEQATSEEGNDDFSPLVAEDTLVLDYSIDYSLAGSGSGQSSNTQAPVQNNAPDSVQNGNSQGSGQTANTQQGGAQSGAQQGSTQQGGTQDDTQQPPQGNNDQPAPDHTPVLAEAGI